MASLLKWLKGLTPTGSASRTPAPGHDGFFVAQPAQALLDIPRRRKLLEHIWQRTSLSQAHFDKLYRAPLARYAELVQQLPASENHHHAHPGGMLDHGLEIVAYALKLRQSYLLPQGAPPETQAQQAEAWTAALAYAALLHDIGKVAVDLEIQLSDGSTWFLWNGPIPLQQAYRFRYRRGRDYQLHGAAAGLLYTRVLNHEQLDWLSGFHELWGSLLYVLAGRYEHAGILGELVIQADKASVAQALGGNPERAMNAPQGTRQRQVVDTLTLLVKEQFKLNQPGPSDGWLTQDSLWLVSKTATDKLRAALLSAGIEGIPSSNSTMFNLLQDQGIILANPDGKAIWDITIEAGTWKHKLSCLKLAPSLVWPAGTERPEPFQGRITIENQPLASETDTTASMPAPVPPALLNQQSPPPAPEISPAMPIATPEAAEIPGTDDIGNLLELMGMDVEMPAQEAEVKQSEPALESIQPPATPVAPTAPTPVPSLQPASPSSRQSTSPGPANPSSEHQSLGQQFITWLRDGILSRKIVINEAAAKVHTLDGTAFLVTPGIFQRFAQEHPELEPTARAQKLHGWELVQRAFGKEKLHRKKDNGLNIWTAKVKGPRKDSLLKGYLLDDPRIIFSEVPYDNPYLHRVE